MGFLCSSGQTFLSVIFVGVSVVHAYSSIDTATDYNNRFWQVLIANDICLFIFFCIILHKKK